MVQGVGAHHAGYNNVAVHLRIGGRAGKDG